MAAPRWGEPPSRKAAKRGERWDSATPFLTWRSELDERSEPQPVGFEVRAPRREPAREGVRGLVRLPTPSLSWRLCGLAALPSALSETPPKRPRILWRPRLPIETSAARYESCSHPLGPPLLASLRLGDPPRPRLTCRSRVSSRECRWSIRTPRCTCRSRLAPSPGRCRSTASRSTAPGRRRIRTWPCCRGGRSRRGPRRSRASCPRIAPSPRRPRTPPAPGTR